MAIFNAVSTASEPEFEKKTWSRSPGASAAMRDATAKALGCPNWNVGAKSSSAAWAWMALTMGSRLWPALVHQSPAVPSITARPSVE